MIHGELYRPKIQRQKIEAIKQKMELYAAAR